MKTLRILSSAFVAILLMMCATACNSDDDPKGPEKAKAVSAKVTYSLYVEKDMLQYVDVKANYTSNGKVQTTAMSDQSPVSVNNRQYGLLEINWPNQKLPIKEIVTVKFTMKSGVELPERISVSNGKEVKYTITYSDGTTRPGGSDKVNLGAMTVPADRFEDYIRRLNLNYDAQEIEIKVEDDGDLDFDFDDDDDWDDDF